jgi:NAD(P)H-dependent flavin oxidoreductase YrpB (nitropropane dioxygenase family)
VLSRYDVPKLPDTFQPRIDTLLGWSDSGGRSHVEIALKHPIRLLVNALGPPPKDVIDRAHQHGVRVAALVGSVAQAKKQVALGVDLIVAQGWEAGGHTGEVSSMVLIPEVVDAVAPVPVLAAGGIGCGRQAVAGLALGAQGVWTGSIWLTVAEAEASPVLTEKLLRASSRDTVRTRSMTGKPARLLRTPWTEAWDGPDSPGPLPMPLQFMLNSDAQARIGHYARTERSRARELVGIPVGQIVGRMNEVRPTREVIHELVSEFVDTVQRLDGLLAAAEKNSRARPPEPSGGGGGEVRSRPAGRPRIDATKSRVWHSCEERRFSASHRHIRRAASDRLVATPQQQLGGVSRVLDDPGLGVQPVAPPDQRREPHALQHVGDPDLLGARHDVRRRGGIAPQRGRDQPRHHGVEPRDLLRELRLARGDRPDQGARQVRTPAQGPSRRLEEARDAFERRLSLGRAQREPRLVLAHQLLEGREQQIFLAAEAAIEGAERDAGVRRHVAQAHRFEAALLGQLDRRLDDAPGAFFHTDIGTCFTRAVQSTPAPSRPGAAPICGSLPASAPIPEIP